MADKKLMDSQLEKAENLDKKNNEGFVKRSNTFLLNLVSYVAVCIGGLALGIGNILGKMNIVWTKLPVIQDFANAVAWAVVSYLSFRFIIKRRKLWMWIVWGIAVALIITGIIL